MNGEGVLKIEGLLNKRETGEKIDQGQNLALWGESYLCLQYFSQIPARAGKLSMIKRCVLLIPYGEQNDSLDFKFDLKTGLISQICGYAL